MDKSINEVRLTDDFNKFKIMKGNRAVRESRVKKILQSFANVGYVQAPIVVNEKMEIIDGQGRYEACMETNQPIAYIVIDGLGHKHCINMNINCENWKTEDYIKSYADLGYENYVRLQDFLDRCHSNRSVQYSTSVLLRTVAGTDISNIRSSVEDGTLQVTAEEVDKAWELLDFFDNFAGMRVNRPLQFFSVLSYLHDIPEVDNYRLIKKVPTAKEKVLQRFTHLSDAIDAAAVIEDAYNDRLSGHVYIQTLYLQELEKINKGIRMNAEMKHKKHGDSK